MPTAGEIYAVFCKFFVCDSLLVKSYLDRLVSFS